MNLVLPSRVEANVARRGSTSNCKLHTIPSTSASVLVPVSIESVEIHWLVVHRDTCIITFTTTVPTIDLVEVELECDRCRIPRDTFIHLVWVLSRPTVGLAIPSEESSEASRIVESSIPPPKERTIFEIFLVDLSGWYTSSRCRSEGRITSRSSNRSVGWPGSRPWAVEVGNDPDVVPTRALVVDVGLVQASLEHDLELAVILVE